MRVGSLGTERVILFEQKKEARPVRCTNRRRNRFLVRGLSGVALVRLNDAAIDGKGCVGCGCLIRREEEHCATQVFGGNGRMQQGPVLNVSTRNSWRMKLLRLPMGQLVPEFPVLRITSRNVGTADLRAL